MTAYFCDGLKEVSIVNGIVRVELQRLEPAKTGGANREMRAVSELILALPLTGFLGLLGGLENLRDQLIKEGHLKPASAAAATPEPAIRSPNFPA